jgi:hypothetical protein
MALQLGEQWSPFDNCQHAARRAYAGQADSPTLNMLVVAGTLVLLVAQANRD